MRTEIRLPLLVLAMGTVLLGGPALTAPADSVEGPARVIDGDTLVIGTRRIRLVGMDAPERDQICQDATGQGWPCGEEAASALRHLLGPREVSCRITGRDSYGRDLGHCATRHIDLGDWMVREGWAIPTGDGQERHGSARRQAETGRKGVWTGPFDDPEDWRRRRREHRPSEKGSRP